MTLEQRLQILFDLRTYLQQQSPELEAVIQRTFYHNAWFTTENTWQALQAISDCFLEETALSTWVHAYGLTDSKPTKTVGLIMAGNIPLVGFHDWLCTFVAGHRAQIKLSSKDQYLLPHLFDWLTTRHPNLNNYIDIVERLRGFDAIIATGSTNTSRYFETYFSKYPNIIRKNRSAVAIFHGHEGEKEFQRIGEDIFGYFGLGCRSVAKLYVPRGYDFSPFLAYIDDHFEQVIQHNKYKNNFDYNLALLILNKGDYYANHCLILRENETIHSPIATLHYEYYDHPSQLVETLQQHADVIQCIVSNERLADLPVVAPGMAQRPALKDYADHIDTLNFLQKLE